MTSYVRAMALACVVALSSAAAPEPEYKIQYYVPQQQYDVEAGPERSGAPAAHQQPRYITAPQEQSYQRQPAAAPAAPRYEQPTHRVAQLLLPSAADRQVAKAAHQIAGPEYAQQIQLVQQQGLANEALVTAQRRAEAIYRRAQQQQQQLTQQSVQQAAVQRQQYLAEIGGTEQRASAGAKHAAPAQYVQQPQYVQQYQQAAQQPQQYHYQYEQEDEREYQPQPAAHRAPPSSKPVYRLRGQEKEKEELEDEHDNDSSYQFGFDVKDDLYTNYQNRKEQRENGKISGSYSVVDSDGFIRTVTYTADPKEGFKAEVVRKPTDIVVKIPKPKESIEQQQPHHHQQQQQQRQHQHQHPQRVQQHQQYLQEEEQYEQQQVQPQYQKYRLPGGGASAAAQKPQIVYQYQ